MLLGAIEQDSYAFDAVFAAYERYRACTVVNGHIVFCSGFVFGLHKTRATTIGVDHHAAKKLETAFVVVSLTAVIRQKLYAAAHQPMHCVSATANERFRKIRVNIILRDAPKIVEIVFRCVLAEICARDVGIT